MLLISQKVIAEVQVSCPCGEVLFFMDALPEEMELIGDGNKYVRFPNGREAHEGDPLSFVCKCDRKISVPGIITELVHTNLRRHHVTRTKRKS